MKDHVLDIQVREGTGKGVARKLRSDGFIPAVLYGHRGTKKLSLRVLDFENLFLEIGEHSIITLNIDGKEKAEVIVKDYQLDPLKKNIIHVDFYEIEKGKKLRTEIPIKVTGTSKGVKKGGILEVFIRDLEIECLPKDIPDSIVVDVNDLEVGDSIHVKDIKVDEKIHIHANPEQVVLTIGSPTVIKAVEEEAVEAEVEAAEAVLEEEVPEPEGKSQKE
jgi:large subunit ribosomal protein L25